MTEESNEKASLQDDTTLSNETLKEEEEISENAKKEKKKISERSPIDVTMPLVLEPDHPMMERFQKALKNHLLKQIDKVTSQVCEMGYELKKKEQEKEEAGLELYKMQQDLFKQQKIIEDCETNIENLMKERQSLDESVKCKKISWKEEINQLNLEKKKEMTMASELSKLASLKKQMEKWQMEMDSELTVSQRISEKTQYDKAKLVEEKRKLDMYLLRLMTEVSNYESEMKLLDGEIEIKLEEKDSLNQTLADAAADLQALITEQKRLLSAWNSVVTTINNKNAVYADVSKELRKCQDGFQALNVEIQSYKKSSEEQMKEGERIAIQLTRNETEFQSSEALLKNLISKKAIVEDNIMSTTNMIARTEADLHNISGEKDKLEGVVNKLRKSVEKLRQELRSIQDESMNALQEQLVNDKSSSQLNKQLRELREKNRKQEFNMLETENKISKKLLEVEELKAMMSQNQDTTKEFNKELDLKEEELKRYEDEITKCLSAVIQKQGNFATLCRKLEKFMESSGNFRISPGQQRINELEKSISELQTKNESLQSFWLLQQNNSVKLTQQRNEQLKDISLLRRQVALLEQRTLKTDFLYNKEKKIESDVNKSIAQLQRKLIVLNETLVGKKGYKENLGKENIIAQVQFVQNLKKSELDQIKLKSQIKDLETNLEELAETMLGTQREILAWEKKIQSAIEAKNDLHNIVSGSGEVGQMKTEIHRMEVRYNHLKRAQEKLISDLEQSVFKRDIIVDGLDAKEQRQTRGPTVTRIAFQKKIDSLKSDIRTIRNERKQINNVIENTKLGHQELKKVILEKEIHLKGMEETTQKMDKQLEEGKLRKIQNLEMLIKRQKKCKMYEAVKSGKHRMSFKSESTLAEEFKKIKSKNDEMLLIMESLIKDFPKYQFHFKKIYNTFEAKPS